MNFKRRIAAITLAAAMAFSTMSFGASAAERVYDGHHAYNDGIPKEAHSKKYEGQIRLPDYNFVLAKYYSEAVLKGLWSKTLYTRAGAEAARYNSKAYSSITIGYTTKSVSNAVVGYYDGIAWTDSVSCDNGAARVVYRGHALY